MIPYEELVAALDRYVSRNGGTPQSVLGPASSGRAAAAPPAEEPPPPVVYDEPHDPDLAPSLGAHGDEDDRTHVGAMPGAAAEPMAQVIDEGSNEIDLGDVLSDEEL